MARTDDHTGDPIPQPQPGQPEYAGRTPLQWHSYWRDELKAEAKRNREWRRCADQITKRVSDKRKDQGPQYNLGSAEFRVNLFYSNTFIQMAYLYGQAPEVDVARRYGDANDDVARVAANIYERILNTSVQSDGGDFPTTMWANLFDHLVPGLGVARIRYEMASHTEDVPPQFDALGEQVAAGFEREVLDWEDAVIQYIHWRDFHWGWGRRWAEVPWLGYDVYMTRDQASERFGPGKAAQLDYKNAEVPAEDENTANPDVKDPKKTAKVCEIWDKKTQTVFWYHESYPGILDIQTDPLELEAFFPTPCPFVANATTDLFYPTPYFMLAQDLYNEIDQLSTRINIITNAVRVGGVYDATYGDDLRKIFSHVENDLHPVKNYAQFAEKGGLKGVAEFFPTRDIAEVLDKLREMRAEAINLLFQVTGIADIMRGQGEKYEGVGKARLKAQFGSVRIRDLQGHFEAWASRLLKLKAEVIAKHFDPATIVEQSNILYSADGRNPELLEAAIGLIKRYQESLWRIRIKPESMAMIDWEEMKASRSEFLTALATYLQSSAPMLQQMPDSAPVLLELLKFGLAGFKGGQEIESVLDAAVEQAKQALAQPRQGQESPEERRSKLKVVENREKTQGDMAKEQQKHVNELKKIEKEARTRLEEIRTELGADIVRERVQADEAIREAQAKEGMGD